MKIAINCAFFQPRGGGIKEYILNLVTNLSSIDQENDYVLYVLRDYYDYAEKHLKHPNFRIKKIPFGGDSRKDKVLRSLLGHRFWKNEEKEERWDLFHSPFFHMPKLNHTKTLITVHDLRFYRYPETYDYLRAKFLRFAVKRSVMKSDCIISISDFTKAELMDAYGIPSSKIHTIHESIDPEKFSRISKSERPDTLPEGKFVLTVGHLEPRKNYDRLIEAFVSMKERKPELKDIKLVIVGKKGCRYSETLKLIESRPNDVVYLNFVSDENLMWLYGNCELFVFPSIYEGFGFPPLEAASMGVISAVSKISSIPEVCGDAVLYFNPYDTQDISHAIEKGLTDEGVREELNKKLDGQLSKFSWKRNAEETLRLYTDLSI